MATTADIALWDWYMVYAAAFGISDKVKRELAKAYPEVTDPEWLDRNASDSTLYWDYHADRWRDERDGCSPDTLRSLRFRGLRRRIGVRRRWRRRFVERPVTRRMGGGMHCAFRRLVICMCPPCLFKGCVANPVGAKTSRWRTFGRFRRDFGHGGPMFLSRRVPVVVATPDDPRGDLGGQMGVRWG